LDGDVCLAIEEFPDVFGIAVKTVNDEGLSDDDVVLVVEEMATGNRDGSAGEGEICDGVGGDGKSVKMKNDQQIKANVFFS